MLSVGSAEPLENLDVHQGPSSQREATEEGQTASDPASIPLGGRREQAERHGGQQETWEQDQSVRLSYGTTSRTEEQAAGDVRHTSASVNSTTRQPPSPDPWATNDPWSNQSSRSWNAQDWYGDQWWGAWRPSSWNTWRTSDWSSGNWATWQNDPSTSRTSPTASSPTPASGVAHGSAAAPPAAAAPPSAALAAGPSSTSGSMPPSSSTAGQGALPQAQPQGHPPGAGSWSGSWNWQGSGWNAGNSGGWSWNRSDSKPDYTDPPGWPGWNFRRHWVQAVRRWDKLTDVPMHKRAERVLRSLGWEMMPDFDHIAESDLALPSYLENIISVLENKAGVREDDEKRKAYRAVMQESQKRRDETYAQFTIRRDKDFTRAAMFGMDLPSSLRATMLKEGAGLSEQNQQNLTTLCQGADDDPTIVARALTRMDIRSDKIMGFAENSSDPSYLQSDHLAPSDSENEEDPEGDELVAAELDTMNLSEDQVFEVYAVLDQKRRKTWKENKQYKAEARKDRGSFMKGDGNPTAPRGRYGGTPGSGFKKKDKKERLSREQLKKISYCRLCLKKGHWAEDCQQGKISSTVQKTNGFAYFGGPAADSSSTHFTFMAASDAAALSSMDVQQLIRWLSGKCDAAGSQLDLSQASFLTIPAHEAILDIGATQDLIGAKAAENLEQQLRQVGLKCVHLPPPACVPSGIGGPAKVAESLLVPISPGGVPGILQMTVLEDNIPPLLSVGFLEFLGAQIDLETNELELRRLGVRLSMNRLASGHRCISLIEWSGGVFPIPEEASRQHKLAPGAFNLHSPVSSPYVKSEQSSGQQFMPSSTTLCSASLSEHEPKSAFQGQSHVIEEHGSLNLHAHARLHDHDHALLHGHNTLHAAVHEHKREGSHEVLEHLSAKNGSACEFFGSFSEKQQSDSVSSLHSFDRSSAQGNFPLMGSRSSSHRQPQFEAEPADSRSHGTSGQEKRGSISCRDIGEGNFEVETADGEGPLHLGKFPHHVFQADVGRERSEEFEVREGSVRGRDSLQEPRVPSPGEMPNAQRKPIRSMDPMRSMRSSSLIPEESQGQGQGSIEARAIRDAGYQSSGTPTSNLTSAPMTPNSASLEPPSELEQVERVQLQTRHSRASSSQASNLSSLENLVSGLMEGMHHQSREMQGTMTQVEQALRQLAMGQGQMLQMMQLSQTSSLEEIQNQARVRANQQFQEMQVENQESQSDWEVMENPNVYGWGPGRHGWWQHAWWAHFHNRQPSSPGTVSQISCKRHCSHWDLLTAKKSSYSKLRWYPKEEFMTPMVLPKAKLSRMSNHRRREWHQVLYHGEHISLKTTMKANVRLRILLKFVLVIKSYGKKPIVQLLTRSLKEVHFHAHRSSQR